MLVLWLAYGVYIATVKKRTYDWSPTFAVQQITNDLLTRCFRSYYKLSFTCKERDILHTRGDTHLRTLIWASQCVFGSSHKTSGAPFRMSCSPQWWNYPVYAFSIVRNRIGAFIAWQLELDNTVDRTETNVWFVLYNRCRGWISFFFLLMLFKFCQLFQINNKPN